MMRSTTASVVFALLLPLESAQANDSEAELAIGGLTLKQSDAISLDSEDLFISQDAVRITYRFTNTSKRDVTTLVAFPLPDLPNRDSDKFMLDYREYLEFRSEIDGNSFPLDYVEQAMRNGLDITKAVRAAGLPVNGGSENFSELINAMPHTKRKQLIDDDLISEWGSNGNPIWEAQWTLRVSVTRQQTFPAGKTVTVTHQYRPISGGSVAGALEAEYRQEVWHKEQVRKYCIEDNWLRTFDKRREKTRGYSEVWLGYILKSGANWKGSIKDFRLVIDKGKTQSLVSFCGEGVKKINDTQFEMRKQNFKPKDDLDILIINWADQ
jgi:hypothetical protein